MNVSLANNLLLPAKKLKDAAVVLGLPPLDQKAKVGKRKAQIAEYLGVHWKDDN